MPPILLAKERQVISLWPDTVPGQKESKSAPVVSKNNHGNVTRIAKVTTPTLTVFPAKPDMHNGAAVIICPGGGYNILAIDKEGYEVAEWLSQLGYTAFVLHYRVPKNQVGALQDAQRAIRTVRSSAARWQIKTDQIGILGFSAGGSLSARASTRFTEELYPTSDAIDQLSARPDFAVLIYPAYLDQGKNRTLTPELKITANTPPLFLFVAGDDPFTNSSLVMGAALTRAKIPYELHVHPKGGHGFGMRPGNLAATTWPDLCAQWLKRTIFTDKK
ncbi:alpha/beta hydrolase [Verrucomicrobiaceae bacterium N1E253]|uniref:Alpha/beta hydrolase n=1 Tax=Oceaniferula marina TaxID=2748318 RepID=A0A851GFI7_9BACT|nr:alpha/beta hydrolase [Oceaniferula marina]NWK55672.1 alpha/beta hydrolase [Oceaniferula marina]